MISIRFTLVSILLAGVSGGPNAPAVQSGISQARLAEWITSGSIGLKEGSIAHILTIPPKEREPVLEDALVKELTRLNAERFSRFAVRRAGGKEIPEDVDGGERNGEYRLSVTQAVTQSSNTKVIPGLVGALGSGSAVSKALAGFGEAAVDPVARLARQPHPDYGAITDAMRALQYMLEEGQPLSPQSRDKILSVAVERLTGRQYFTHVMSAADLAIATKDLALRRRVEQLASDPGEVAKMDIKDPSLAKYVHNAAVAALAKK